MSEHEKDITDSERDSFFGLVSEYQSIRSPENLHTQILAQTESIGVKKVITLPQWAGAIAATLLVYLFADFSSVFDGQQENELYMLPSIAAASRYVSKKPELRLPSLSTFSGMPTLPGGELTKFKSKQNLTRKGNKE